MSDVVVLRPSSELVQRAAALALRLDHLVYDCVYLACAEAEAAPLATADDRLSRLVPGGASGLGYLEHRPGRSRSQDHRGRRQALIPLGVRWDACPQRLNVVDHR